jgi:hypothetical protein
MKKRTIILILAGVLAFPCALIALGLTVGFALEPRRNACVVAASQAQSIFNDAAVYGWIPHMEQAFGWFPWVIWDIAELPDGRLVCGVGPGGEREAVLLVAPGDPSAGSEPMLTAIQTLNGGNYPGAPDSNGIRQSLRQIAAHRCAVQSERAPATHQRVEQHFTLTLERFWTRPVHGSNEVTAWAAFSVSNRGLAAYRGLSATCVFRNNGRYVGQADFHTISVIPVGEQRTYQTNTVVDQAVSSAECTLIRVAI